MCAISLRFCRALDFSPGCGITNMKRALPISGQLNSGLQNSFETVTWQWRFLLFTQIVMVKRPICTVSVIGMVLTCFIGNAANRLSVMAMLFPAPCGDKSMFLSAFVSNIVLYLINKQSLASPSGRGARRAERVHGSWPSQPRKLGSSPRGGAKACCVY